MGNAIADSAGAAQDMADTQLDNLAGDVTLFQSALEGAKIAVSDRLTPTLRNFVQLGSEGISAVSTAFREEGLEGAMKAAGEWLSTLVGDITSYLPDMVNAGMQLLGAFGQGLIDNLPMITAVTMDIMGMIFKGILNSFPEILLVATEIIITLIQGLTDATPELVPVAISAILILTGGLIDNLPLILEAGLELLLALVDGIVDNVDLLVDGVLTLVSRLITTIIEHLPQILELGVRIVLDLVAGLIKAAPDLVNAIPKLVTAIIDGFLDVDWGKVGSDILDGIGSGIAASAGKLIDSAKEAAKGALNGMKDFLGIHSPSRVFRDEVGKMLDLGIAEGLEENTGSITKAINEVAGVTENPLTRKAHEIPNYVRGGTSNANSGSGADGGIILESIFELLSNRKELVEVHVHLGNKELRREIIDAEDERNLRNGGR